MELSRARERLLRRIATRRGREAEGVVLLEGPRLLWTALDLGIQPAFAMVDAESTSGSEGGALALRARLEAAGVEVVALPSSAFRSFAQTETPQGVLAVAPEPRRPDPAPAELRGCRLLLLDGVRDPGNVGTLVRSAAALGIDRCLLLDGTADPWSAKALRASAGLAFALPVHCLPWEGAAEVLHEAGVPLLVAGGGGEDLRSWLAAAPTRPEEGWALLLGNEGEGPRSDAIARARARLAVPMVPGVDSLNVSIAGSILLWALGPGREAAPVTSGRTD